MLDVKLRVQCRDVNKVHYRTKPNNYVETRDRTYTAQNRRKNKGGANDGL